MPYTTDERLKNFLDTNQLHREQMCLAILSIDSRFIDVRPRHPRGGPDGGRDIEAVFKNDQIAFGAVGFVNQADDSAEKKTRVFEKFKEDVQAAISANPTPSALFFLTNINCTAGEKDELIVHAKAKGFQYCEIYDRERMRIILDSPDGFSIRFQFLGISLSEAEQATFFAKWGDDIQSLISTGFHAIQGLLDRVLFLQESYGVLSSLNISFELDKLYPAEDIGHFRAFCSMFLKEPKCDIFSIVFGSSDKAHRFIRDDESPIDDPSGIKHGISGAQWVQKASTLAPDDDPIFGDAKPVYEKAGSSSAIGAKEIRFIHISYGHDSFIRLSPRMCLRDLDEAMFLPMVNRSLANRIKCIHIFANEYKLLEISKFKIGKPNRDDDDDEDDIFQTKFSDSELDDEWVLLRPADGSSSYRFSFSDITPNRLFIARKTENSLKD